MKVVKDGEDIIEEAFDIIFRESVLVIDQLFEGVPLDELLDDDELLCVIVLDVEGIDVGGGLGVVKV